ncbi:hypothetical protein [Arthrobacter sp. UYEF6]|uniref:hypothetical protein n=1 Tax=Pseudarthrobacter sp. S6 TaxID=3418420 RepID=UPI003397528C
MPTSSILQQQKPTVSVRRSYGVLGEPGFNTLSHGRKLEWIPVTGNPAPMITPVTSMPAVGVSDGLGVVQSFRAFQASHVVGQIWVSEHQQSQRWTALPAQDRRAQMRSQVWRCEAVEWMAVMFHEAPLFSQSMTVSHGLATKLVAEIFAEVLPAVSGIGRQP